MIINYCLTYYSEIMIERLMIDSFVKLKESYEHRNENFLITVPKYADGRYRLSEQEMRFAFVETLIRSNADYRYSVETPTSLKYRFSRDNRYITPEEGDGQSALIDLSLYQGDKTFHIEFKCGTANPHEYAKDFIKLNNEPAEASYFVNIFRAMDAGTKQALMKNLFDNPYSINIGKAIFLGFDISTGDIYKIKDNRLEKVSIKK